jgi:Xaa-Pro aminopeptidase
MDRVRLFLSSLRADALLVSHLPNIQYLCGFSGSAGLLLVEPESSTLFTDGRYTAQAHEEVLHARVRITNRGLLRALAAVLLVRRGRRSVAYSPAHIAVAQKNALEAATGRRVRWVEDRNAVEKLRAVKDADELEHMRAAAIIASDAFGRVVPSIKPGVTELTLAAEIEYQMRRSGAARASFETIVASGARSAWAHARPGSKRLRKSELVVLDHGAILRFYCSDITRTVFLGRAPKKVRRLYRAVLEAQAVAKRAIRPGVMARDVDRAARGVLKGYGLAKYFTHSTGHGLGLEVHEAPRIGRGEETVLERGMVLTVEPGVYLEGLGGIRIEDDVLVTANGFEDLSTAPRDFLEL